MKILIRGAGFENKGAEAMMRVVQREIGRRLSSVSFHSGVFLRERSFAYQSGFVPLFYAPSSRMQLLRKLPFLPRIPEYLLARKNPDFSQAIKTNTKAAYEINAIGSIDAVIDVSGFAYSDSCAWGKDAVKVTQAWTEYCHVKNKPYIFMSQAWGPFDKPEIAGPTRTICEKSSLLISRDDESTKYLAKLQNVHSSSIRQAPDIAFCFGGAPPEVGRTIIRGLGLSEDRPIIGVVPNMRVYERLPGVGADNQYVKLLISLVDHCTAKLGAKVLLMPNEIKVSGAHGPDDRFLCCLVASQIKNAEHCCAVRDYYPAETVKSILGQLDMLISSRFHSLVFALSEGVPVLALGWSHKYQELLRPFDLEKFVVDHDQLEVEGVITLIEEAWEIKEKTSKRIRAVVPDLQFKVDALFDDVAEIIRKANS